MNERDIAPYLKYGEGSSASPSEREIEAVARAWWAHEPAAFDSLDGRFRQLQLTRAKAAIAALDRARDARGDDEETKVHARGPQYDDAAKMDALGRYLEQYPPSGFAERYSADGWRHIARGVLSAASIFFPARSPVMDRTEVEALAREMHRFDRNTGRARYEWELMQEGYREDCRRHARVALDTARSPQGEDHDET